MDLSDAELELVVESIGMTVSARSRKARRVPQHMKKAAEEAVEEAEALIARVWAEQRQRRKTSA